MTKHEQPWIVSIGTLLTMVERATLNGFHQSVYRDKLQVKLPSATQPGDDELLGGDELFENYKHLCLDYQQGEDNA